MNHGEIVKFNRFTADLCCDSTFNQDTHQHVILLVSPVQMVLECHHQFNDKVDVRGVRTEVAIENS